MMVMERYPDIKSNENVKMLMAELGKTEGTIAQKRDAYNNVVTNYNINIKRFPKSLFASMFGYDERTLFKAESGAEKAPDVSFE
jgi:LemA protein